MEKTTRWPSLRVMAQGQYLDARNGGEVFHDL